MNIKKFLGVTIILMALAAIITPQASAQSNTLTKADFHQTSFQKTVDYFDYARAYATLNGIATPANFDKWHANINIAYINTSEIQLLYAGLDNITTDGSSYLRLPTQSILMHYKTGTDNQDVITAQTFLMLMAFNDTSTSSFEGSPDAGDNLYASFSLGFDLSSIGVTMPAKNSKTETIPLTCTNNNLQWTWGINYTNLTALWWKTWIDPKIPHIDNSLPCAVTTYDELAFRYTLTIDPANNQAKLTENHIIGRMRDLLIGQGLIWLHLNSTGTYGLFGRQISDQTLYQFLDKNQIKMSIVNYQTTITANRNTISTTTSGQNVANTETTTTDTAIDTYTDNGQKTSTTDFAAKPTYDLYNFTADPAEASPTANGAVTRTANASGFAGNTALFKPQMDLMKFLPLVVAQLYPGLYEKAKTQISDMSKADYFYLTSYPTYSGYRIEHDPVTTVYLAQNQTGPNANGTGLIIIVIASITIITAATVIITKRKPKATN